MRDYIPIASDPVDLTSADHTFARKVLEIPIASDPVDLTSADHTFARKVHGIRAEIVKIKMTGGASDASEAGLQIPACAENVVLTNHRLGRMNRKLI